MPDFITLDAIDLPPLATPPQPPRVTVLALGIADATVAPALCAVRYEHRLLVPGDPLFGESPIFETHYRVLGTELLPLGGSYPAVAARVNTLAKRLYDRDDRGDYHVLVDASGIGKPAVDDIRASIIPQAHVTGVTIGSGDRGDLSILWRHESTVGLLYLISRLQAILQGGRLHVPADAGSTALLDGLRAYDLAHAPAVDLVRTLALACASEFAAVRYDRSPDSLPSPRL